MQKKWVLLIAVASVVIVLDQWSKYVVLRELTTAFDASDAFGERLHIFTSDAPSPGFDGYHFRQKRTVTVSESFMRLRYAENPGAAFGLFRGLPDGLRGPLFHLVSIGAVFLILHYFRKLNGSKEEVWAVAGLPLVLGGAIGNYLCRLSRSFVIDFIDAHWKDDPSLVWPSFNIADSAIVVGVGLLVIDSFVRKENNKKVAVPEPAE
ncbi:MAG: signal peptidase II [Myxococcaceae bacterium]|nr:signal peptidase II [Myxococcaceae bacterium]